MIGHDEVAAWSRRLGVTEPQVRRDHLISHALAALADLPDLVLYGGTGLMRTFGEDARLSEDIDLLAGDVRLAVQSLERVLPVDLEREFGRLRWDPPPRVPRVGRDGAGRLLTPHEGPTVRVHVLPIDWSGFRWPTQRARVTTRYSDVAAVEMTVPTVSAFAAMKTTAWDDRQAARDLFDLAVLADAGALDRSAARLLERTRGAGPVAQSFRDVPAGVRRAWRHELAHQTGRLPSPDDCLRRVWTAWRDALGWEP